MPAEEEQATGDDGETKQTPPGFLASSSGSKLHTPEFETQIGAKILTDKGKESVTTTDAPAKSVNLMNKKVGEASPVIGCRLEMENEALKDTEVKGIPKLVNRGMKLNYVAPTLKHGVPVACLDKHDIELEASK